MEATSAKPKVPWNKGLKLSPLTVEHRLKIGEGVKRHGPNAGTFKKGHRSWLNGTKGLISNPLKGAKMSQEWKDALSAGQRGCIKPPRSEEHRKKLSESMKRRVGVLSPRWKGGVRAVQSARRRERLILNGGSHTFGEWETLKARCNWTCVNPACARKEPEIKLTRDHIVSLKDGGSDNIENIQPLCMRCNVKKHSKSIRYV